jgi:hypothetical protein
VAVPINRRDYMVNEEFSTKLKKLKSKPKKRGGGGDSPIIKYVAIFLLAIVVLFGLYVVYDSIHNNQVAKEEVFEQNKELAINTTNQMFSRYPDDPNKQEFILQIKNCKNDEELSKVLSNVKNYITFREYKESIVNSIKDTYGKYYDRSFYAKSLVNKIENAQSREEINEIIQNSNIEENAKEYYINDIKNQVAFGNSFEVEIGNNKKLMNGDELINYVKKLSLVELKSINITPVVFDKVTMVVSASQCGKIPHAGDKILIYYKNDTSKEPIMAIINSSYVIVKDISYSESKSTSSSLNDGGDSSSVSSTSSISYSLNNVPGILHATAADRLDYNKINEKFGKYGEKLNKIESDTQIFDDSVKYLLILSVPTDSVPDLISLKSSNAYIVKAG